MITDSEFTEEQKRTLAEKQKKIEALQAQIAAQRKEKDEWEREHLERVGRPFPSIGSMLLTDEIRKQAEEVQALSNGLISASSQFRAMPNSYLKLKAGMKIKTTFDEYEIVKQVGQGGCGRVFSGKNSEGQEFAIKFLDRSIGNTKLKRFKNEVSFSEHTLHPNIVHVIDHGFLALGDAEYVFCVMPLYTQSLRDKMNVGIKSETAINILTGLLSGIQYAHKKGIIHRDIKPENIMFGKDSEIPVICDFGIAHFLPDDMVTMIVTKPTERLANFVYSAPEQRIKGLEAVPQSDVFAIGLILNEMFTHFVPQGTGYRLIKDVAPDYGFLDDLVEKLLRADINERLYPVEKILTELKVLAEKHANQKELTRLGNVIEDMVLPKKVNLSLIDKRFENSCLIFVMDQDVPEEWFSIMRDGSFSHTSVWGYDTHSLNKTVGHEIIMPIAGNENVSVFGDIVKNFKEWIPIVNAKYNETMEVKARQRQREAEESRKSEIARLERKNAINQALSQMP